MAEIEQMTDLGNHLGAAMESVHLNLEDQSSEKEPANAQVRPSGSSVRNEEESAFGDEEPMEVVQ